MNKLNAVLLVDDDPACIFIARKIIKRHGYSDKFLAAHNGLEALHLMQSVCQGSPNEILCPSLVLVDVKMPVMDGFAFLEAMRELSLPFTPVIGVLTSSVHERDRAMAEGMGVDGYLNKPLTTGLFREFIERHESMYQNIAV